VKSLDPKFFFTGKNGTVGDITRFLHFPDGILKERGTGTMGRAMSSRTASVTRRKFHPSILGLLACVFLGGLAGCQFDGGSVVSTGLNTSPLVVGQTDQSIVPSGSGVGKVSVSWEANREAPVNSPGGGYRVYYSQTAAVTASTPFVNVPAVSGAAPTSVEISGLASGTYTISVVAYSALNTTGSVAAQTTVTLK
jgi:hypothetical protein